MVVEKGWTVVTGRRRGSKGGSKDPRVIPTTTNGFNWRMHCDLIDIGGRGDCWWQSILQRHLMSEGLLHPVHAEQALLKDGKRGAEVDKLDKLASGVRNLTVAALEADPFHPGRDAFTVEEQSAVTPEEIEEMATTVRRDIGNFYDWKNSILHPRGLGDDLAAEVLAASVGMHDFAVVQERVDSKDGDSEYEDGKYLRTNYEGNVANMVYYDYGHFRAVILKDECESNISDEEDLEWVVDYLLELIKISREGLKRIADSAGTTSTDAGVDASGTGAEASADVRAETSVEGYNVTFGSYLSEVNTRENVRRTSAAAGTETSSTDADAKDAETDAEAADIPVDTGEGTSAETSAETNAETSLDPVVGQEVGEKGASPGGVQISRRR